MEPLHYDTLSIIEKVSKSLEDLYSFRVPAEHVEHSTAAI